MAARGVTPPARWLTMQLPVRSRLVVTIFAVVLFFLPSAKVYGETCERVVYELNSGLRRGIDEAELVDILRTLNRSGNRSLPPKFVTKQQARSYGWRPGRDLWSVRRLRGTSMGGDRFRNMERRLPERNWREADLGYHGGHRGAKRLIFSDDGLRYVTVDHYRRFIEVPPCR